MCLVPAAETASGEARELQARVGAMGLELRKVTHELTAARDDAKCLRVSFVVQLRVTAKHSYEEHSCSRSLCMCVL